MDSADRLTEPPPPDPGAFRLVPGLARAQAVATLRRAFAAAGLDSAALDARILAAAALRISAVALLTQPNVPLDEAETLRLEDHARRRLAREPVARIVGEVEFWGMPFRLSPGSLVPRPDTEATVQAALDAYRASGEEPRTILDLGTGSGCILVALLSELPNAVGIGIDHAPDALVTARENARLNGVAERAGFVASRWGAALNGGIGLIVSNPPYIRQDEIPLLEPEVSRHDPAAALDGGPDGLAAYREILSDGRRLLAPGGSLVLEIGHDQADSVGGLARQHGFALVASRADLGGHARALVLAIEADLVPGR